MTTVDNMCVEELWWEDDALCIKTTKGQVLKFAGAYMQSVDYHFESDENVIVERVPLVYEKVKSCLK